MNNIAVTYVALGRIDEAREHIDTALTTCSEINSTHLETELLNTRGIIHRHAGKLAEALSDHNQALKKARALGLRPEEPRALEGIASAHVANGDQAKAEKISSEAVRQYRELGLPQPTKNHSTNSA